MKNFQDLLDKKSNRYTEELEKMKKLDKEYKDGKVKDANKNLPFEISNLKKELELCDVFKKDINNFKNTIKNH